MQPFSIEVQPDGTPLMIRCGDNALQVEKVLERWRDTGCWGGKAKVKRASFRVLWDGGIREICRDLLSRQWFLYRIYD